MEKSERDRLLQALVTLQQIPEMGYKFADCPPGINGVGEWSLYLTELWFKIDKTGTQEQKSRVEKLLRAYKMIIQDLNESYMLALLYAKMKKKWRDQVNENEALRREIIEHKKEIEKLTKSLKFDE